jgi:hypothetical protein
MKIWKKEKEKKEAKYGQHRTSGVDFTGDTANSNTAAAGASTSYAFQSTQLRVIKTYYRHLCDQSWCLKWLPASSKNVSYSVDVFVRTKSYRKWAKLSPKAKAL